MLIVYFFFFPLLQNICDQSVQQKLSWKNLIPRVVYLDFTCIFVLWIVFLLSEMAFYGLRYFSSDFQEIFLVPWKSLACAVASEVSFHCLGTYFAKSCRSIMVYF